MTATELKALLDLCEEVETTWDKTVMRGCVRRLKDFLRHEFLAHVGERLSPIAYQCLCEDAAREAEADDGHRGVGA